MSREIKFRAWDKDKKLMIIPEVIGLNYERFVWCHNRSWLHNCQYWDGEDGFSDNFDLMQFTGLCDKHGKEIYEGDIVKTATDKNMVVGWSNKFASFVIHREGWMFQHWFGEACDPEDCEVIGNIFENSDLLK